MAIAPASEAPLSLTDLLSTLYTTLSAASTTDSSIIFNPKSDATINGISLLTTKNELLLSYIQNLVFLTVLKLRSLSGRVEEDGEEEEESSQLRTDAIGKLVELRTYMEKGVKPLEGKLKYQIEKVIRAAEDADRAAAVKAMTGSKGKAVKKAKNLEANDDDSEDESDEGSSEDDEDEEEQLDELSYRPNPAALQQKLQSQQQKQSASRTSTSTGAYKPPRINPVSMPTTTTNTFNDKADRASRPQKSALIDDYISSELSSAPQSMPSIGSQATFTAHGRKQISSRQRAEQADRTRYEEENFVRLPAESKADRRKKNKGGRGQQDGGYGGEDFRGLGQLGERIGRVVSRKGERGGMGDALSRSRKRSAMDIGGGGGDGSAPRMGQGFEKRRKIIEDRQRRKSNR